MADFNYFDQYQDMPIDLSPYLNSVPTTASTYTFSNIQPVVTTIKNLFQKLDFIVDYKNNLDSFIFYNIKDNQFVESVSYEVYDTVEYWWLIYIFNDIKEPFKDWPLTQTQVLDLAQQQYDKERKYSYNTYHKIIFDKNEEKRKIKIPRAFLIPDIIWKYRQAILAG